MGKVVERGKSREENGERREERGEFMNYEL
jgi:hypothetical protein